uniref:Non-structural protein NS1 n=1 Tax=Corriparta virus TaxID=40053 RepID=A0A8E8PIE8_9REOV|nr:hydrophobic tubular protein [Corriparta virus]
MARLIDELVLRYRNEIDEWQKSALMICWELREMMVCSHRLLDCRLYGMCVRQDYELIVEEVLERNDRRGLRQVIEVAMASILNGRDIWCQLVTWSERVDENFDQLWREAMGSVESAYALSQFEASMSRLRRNGAAIGYTYIDDSRSLLHAFFIPLSTERELIPSGDDRLGRFYIMFLQEGEIPNAFSWQRERDVQPTVDRFLRYGREHYPRCDYTGSKAPVQWIVFFPERMKPYMRDEKMRTRILRTMDCDVKFLDSFGTRDGEDIFQQRMGVRGSSLRKFVLMLTARLDGGLSLCEMQWLKQTSCFEDCYLPSLLVRMYFRGELDVKVLRDWFDRGSECQLCFLQHVGIHQVTLMDVRTAKEAKVSSSVLARILTHTYTQAFKPPELFDGEMLSRQGVHWIAVQCQNVRQAGYVTSSLLHRYLRMDGLGTREVQCVAMYCLVRWYLMWIPNGSDLRACFRNVLYVLLGKHAEKGVAALDWTDLGSYLKSMFSTGEESLEFHNQMHVAMLSLTKAVLQFLKHGGIEAHENVEEMYPRIVIDEAMAAAKIEELDALTLSEIRDPEPPVMVSRREVSTQWRVNIEDDEPLH